MATAWPKNMKILALNKCDALTPAELEKKKKALEKASGEKVLSAVRRGGARRQ